MTNIEIYQEKIDLLQDILEHYKHYEEFEARMILANIEGRINGYKRLIEIETETNNNFKSIEQQIIESLKNR